MKKITEIYIQKEYMKSERDLFGNRIKIPTIGSFKRDPILISHGLRFAHYLIDLVIIFLIQFAIVTLILLAVPEVMNYVYMFSFYIRFGSFTITYDLLSYLIFILYYLITEATMQRSIGKFATSTVVIDEYGNKPSTSTLLARSVSRIIPFETLSCLGARGWHDKISRTYVVKKSEAEELKRLLLDKDEMYISDLGDILD